MSANRVIIDSATIRILKYTGATTFLALTDTPTTYAGQALKIPRVNAGGTALEFSDAGAGDALVANPLSQFAATTSAQIRGVISDETGSGLLYFQGGDIGTPSAGVATNLTGTAAGLTAGTVTTNANLTGPVTSSGNATAIANGAILNAMLANGAVANLSGTNTGDQTSIVGITGTLAQFNTALSDADFATGGGTVTGASSGTNTGDQTSIVGITGTLAQFNTALSDADFATGGGTVTGASSGTNTGDQTSVSGNSGSTNALNSATTTINVSAAAEPTIGQVLTATSSTTATWQTVAGTGDALVANPLSQFAATTSAQLRGVISDETGSGLLYFQGGDLGTPSAGVATNLTGTAAGLTAGTVTTNANLTGPVTSTGNATAIANGAISNAMLANSAVANLSGTNTGDQTLVGLNTIWLPAKSMEPRLTNGPSVGTIELSTNKIMIMSLDFDATTEEFAQFRIGYPKGFNNGTVTFQPFWSHAATTTNFGVVFAVRAVAVGNDDAQDVAFGTEQSSTDTGGTTNDEYIGPTSAAITISGVAEGDESIFEISRKVADGGDTMAIDARLQGIKVLYTVSTLFDD